MGRSRMLNTPIQELGEFQGNRLYIKREDMIPYSFGGNKARKAEYFFREIDNGDYDCVVTYGSSSSNHCRIVSNMAASRGIACYIISPEETSKPTFNSQMMDIFRADITVVPVEQVHDTIENKIEDLKSEGKNPYFIAGGGHGNLGTQAYVDCYEEIRNYEEQNGVHFDYIFFASGTGTTQAGLVCGQLMHNDKRKIVGISIARKNPRGRTVVLDSIRDYMLEHNLSIGGQQIEGSTSFVDDYTGSGYGRNSDEIKQTIFEVLVNYGIPMDVTYTGKAFYGMKKYIEKERISEKNILFIHTGGTPLFFDFLKGNQRL